MAALLASSSLSTLGSVLPSNFPTKQCASNQPWKAGSSLGNLEKSWSLRSSSKKNTSFTDRILDYIEGGPKLRKWYGASDQLPKDGALVPEEDESEEDESRDAILVSNGDSEIGQLDFYRRSTGIQALMNSNARKLAEGDEVAVKSLGIPYTIIRAGLLQNTPGGEQGFSFKEGGAAEGKLSKEDAAVICVEALDSVPPRGLVFEVVNGEEKVSDWKECFASLIRKYEQLE